MSEWLDVALQKDFKKGTRHIVDSDDVRILVLNYNDEYYAIESMCTHAMFELDDAELEDACIVCPLHGAKFSIKTGEVVTPPAYEALESYPVRINDGMVQVDVA